MNKTDLVERAKEIKTIIDMIESNKKNLVNGFYYSQLVKQLKEIQDSLWSLSKNKKKTVYISYVDRDNHKIVNITQICDFVNGIYHGIEIEGHKMPGTKPDEVCGMRYKYVASSERFRDDIIIEEFLTLIETCNSWIRVSNENIEKYNKIIKSSSFNN